MREPNLLDLQRLPPDLKFRALAALGNRNYQEYCLILVMVLAAHAQGKASGALDLIEEQDRVGQADAERIYATLGIQTGADPFVGDLEDDRPLITGEPVLEPPRYTVVR